MELLTLFFLYAAAAAAASSAVQSSSFSCNSTGVTCNGLVGYVPPNATTLSAVKTLFAVKNFRSLLGANNLPPSTSLNQRAPANQTIKIPFPCICTAATANANATATATGRPKNPPVYKVVPGDGLFHIAEEVFSRLVTYQEIQHFNNISNPELILVGQELRIPLPCSCGEVAGERVVHYGHVVDYGSTVGEIAQKFNTSEAILLELNGLASSKDLKGGVALDVPLKACTSMVGNKSLDNPLLVSNGTYVFTAGNCVKCTCDAAANNWMLQCEPSNVKSSIWPTCPSMHCQGAGNLYLGNVSSSSCNGTCAYAGYTKQTILTTLASESTCNVSNSNSNNASKFSLHCWSWSFILAYIQLALFCLHFRQ